MSAITVTKLLDRLQAIEAEGHGEAEVYAYFGEDGLLVQAEPEGVAATTILTGPTMSSACGGEAQ